MSTQKPKLSAEAKAIVKKAIENIKANPLQFNMGHWVESETSCGTTACLAGHVALAAVGPRGIRQGYYITESSLKRKLKSFLPQIRIEPIYFGSIEGGQTSVASIEDTAKAILGGEAAENLFFVELWPTEFRDEFKRLQDDNGGCYRNTGVDEKILRKRAILAVKRLRHFLKTGE